MKTQKWMDAGSACAVLGVRRQTLYAYVSRGLLQACSDPGDPRRSLYLAADVTALAAKHKRPRARAEVAAGAIRWGDPVLDTAVSDVRDGVLFFGQTPATDLAQNACLENIAEHHWKVPCEAPETGGWPVTGATALERAMATLVKAAGDAPALTGRLRADIAREGAGLLQAITAASLGIRPQPRPAHEVLAEAWRTPEAATLIRQALVLISDHDLNPSTFAVRVCASTGASLPASLLAGLTTLSGPRHGGVGAAAAQAIRAGRTMQAARRFLDDHPDLEPYAFGFGHPHYPDGDCRAVHLLTALGQNTCAVQCVVRLGKALELAPNVDAALAALALHFRLPAEATFVIFAVGRTVGWVAHAIEQAESGAIIRPKARFVG